MTAATLRGASPFSDPAETLEKARHLVDVDSGIIRVLYESPVDPDAPQVFGFGSVLADTSRYDVESFGLVNGSTSIVRDQAAAGAVGEAIERYACRLVPYGDLVRGTYRSLARKALDPRLTVLYDVEQHARRRFPYRRFDPDEPISWVEAHCLTTDTACLLPAVSAYMADVDENDRRPLVQQTTNGLACGNTVEEAVLAGLTEVVERDASMRTWYRHTPAPRLDPATATDPGLLTCLRLFERARVPVVLVELTQDAGIPVVLASTRLGVEHCRTPVFATSAALSLQRAAQGALEELAQCIPWVKVMFRQRAGRPPKPVDRLASTEDHVMWVTEPAHQHRVEFLTAGEQVERLNRPEPPSGADAAVDVTECVLRLAAVGMDVVVADVTPPDVAAVGLSVVRTVVTEALPLYFGSGLWRIGRRARESSSGDPETAALNYFPHPFP